MKSRIIKDGTPINYRWEDCEKNINFLLLILVWGTYVLQASNVIGLFSDAQWKGDEIVQGANQSSGTNQDEATLIQFLGPGNLGQMRAMGKNMSKTKLACFQVKHKSISEIQEKQIHLKEKGQWIRSWTCQREK